MADKPHHEDDHEDWQGEQAHDPPSYQPPSWNIADDDADIYQPEEEDVDDLHPLDAIGPVDPGHREVAHHEELPQMTPKSKSGEESNIAGNSNQEESSAQNPGARYRMRPPDRYQQIEEPDPITDMEEFLHIDDSSAEPELNKLLEPNPVGSEPAPKFNEEPEVPFPVAPPLVDKNAMTKREKIFYASAIGLAILFIAGLSILIKGLQPEATADDVVTSTSMPLRGEFSIINDIHIGWVKDPPHGLTPYSPMATIKFAENTPSGALRIFFLNQLGRQIGDTENITIAPGETITVIGTGGLPNELSYLDMRSTNFEFWTVRIMEGPSPSAPIASFRPLIHLRVPWTIGQLP